MKQKERYRLVPQMEAYDRLGWDWRPYIMFSQSANFSSQFVNTDLNGFRYSYDKNNNLINHNTITEANIFIGGSTAFGVGATRDAYTIPSFLNKKTKEIWLNFAGRAYTSAQELILFLFYHQDIKKINKIVIFSGINDLTIFFMSKYFDKNFGEFFFSTKFYENMTKNYHMKNILLRPILTLFLKKKYGNLNFKKLGLSDLINLVIKNKNIYNFKHLLNENKIINDPNTNLSQLLKIFKKNINNWKIISEYYNAKITYIFQPFSDWLINRTITDKEKNIFNILNKIEGKTWKELSYNLREKHIFFSNEIKNICEEFNIKFYDSNVYLDHPNFSYKNIFVDRVHLTDLGYEIIANYIKDLL